MKLIKRRNLYRGAVDTIEATVSTTARLRTARAQEEIRRGHSLQRRPDSGASIGQHLGADLVEYRRFHRAVPRQKAARRYRRSSRTRYV